MFCFQCQQTAKGTGCTVSGVCGKKPDTAGGQDELTCEVIALASVMQAKNNNEDELVTLITDALFTCVTNVSFDTASTAAIIEKIRAHCLRLGGGEVIKPGELFTGDEDIRSLRSLLLFGMRGMSAYAHHARNLGKRDSRVDGWFIKGMTALGQTHTAEQWLDLLMEFGGVNLRCMEILDEAHNAAYGKPVPIEVPLKIEKGPFIVVSGHSLSDLQMLLEQTDGAGVNVYTHGEMLPAHGYPGLKKHPQLKGNFGTAWQNQQNEFNDLQAPVIFTSNCLMPPRSNYADRIYTTSVVQFPGMVHIGADANGRKDFSAVIAHAKKLGGYPADKFLTGINGGAAVTTGYGRQTVLDSAPAIIDAVKSGAIKHFFLVGGCDGAHPGRNYFTNFVKQTPKDTVVLTLACGKFRFNDIDAGKIGPFPRILDMGQCNDAYGAVQVALALAKAFNCGVNDLPLSLVLSWYEQKAVCVLLTLLSLGIKNILLGPSLPAFTSPNVLKILVDKFGISPISTPEADLAKILKK
ncbi:MAG: hydroxylamine reductase [Treponema sp.]|nr:hydroxylamine reductase [Treponema sp.]